MAAWVGQTLPPGTAQEGWQAACWDGTYFHLFDDSFGSANNALRSATAASGSWASTPFPAIDVRAASGFGTSVIAVGAGGNMARSANNGASWTADTMPTGDTWVSICNNGSRFVALHSTSTTNQIAYSDDGGATWASATIATGGASISGRTVLWTGTKFVAILYNGNTDRAICSTSIDGTIWSAFTTIYASSYDPIWAANIGGVIVVVASLSGSGILHTIRSADHAGSWTYANTGIQVLSFGTAIHIHADASMFYILGYRLIQPISSADGITWGNDTLPSPVTEAYFLPGAAAGGGSVNVAASNYQASFAMTLGSAGPVGPTLSPFFHFTF